MGFDDGPSRRGDVEVPVAGVVCSDDRFEGLLWTRCDRDGVDATEAVAAALLGSRFHAQVHAVLIDGLTLGGLNVVDLAALHDAVRRPCVAVLRRPPDLTAFDAALGRLPRAAERRAHARAAGTVHALQGRVFQVVGATPDVTRRLLDRLTVRGHVPEPLRLAHLVAGAVVRGESGRRA